MNDILSRFLIDDSPVRGEVVQLSESWQTMLERASYPAEVQKVLGEAVAATALLAQTIKFDGALILQVQGDGPISLLVVQATSDNTVRGMARHSDEVDGSSLKTLFGTAQMAITVEQGEHMQDYQGIVPLIGERLQDALGSYFEQSEQLPTHLWLAANDQTVAGLLLQKLPGEDQDGDLWNRVNQLAETVREEELLELDGQTVLNRLFHEESVRLFEGEPLSFKCKCSREAIANTLISLGQDDVEALLEEQGEVRADCQFCQAVYLFDKVDVANLFAELSQPGSDSLN